MKNIKIDFVIPSFHSPFLTEYAIRSFEKYKGNFTFKYIVVENSKNDTYKDYIESLGDVLWIQNETDLIRSDANADAFEKGLKRVESEYVFLCHNDVVACSDNWMVDTYEKVLEGNEIVGMNLDVGRVGAIHSSGMLVKSVIAESVSMFSVLDDKNNLLADCSDLITVFCREKGIKHFCFANTFVDKELIERIELEKFRSLRVDRTISENGEVIYLHLGRGHEKALGIYTKPNRTYIKEWLGFVEENVL